MSVSATNKDRERLRELNDSLIKTNQDLLQRNGPLIEALEMQRVLLEQLVNLAIESGMTPESINNTSVVNWVRELVTEVEQLRIDNNKLRLNHDRKEE